MTTSDDGAIGAAAGTAGETPSEKAARRRIAKAAAAPVHGAKVVVDAFMVEPPPEPELADQPLWRQVRVLIREDFRPPFEHLAIVVCNALLLVLIWFMLNPALVARYTSLIFLPCAIASWAFADIPATNLFGSAPKTAQKLMDDKKALRRYFTARNIALWVLISPACLIVVAILAPSQDQPLLSVATGVAVLALPFAYLGVCSLFAPLLPFHRMKLRERRQRKDTWFRYTCGLLIPYVLTTPAALLTVAPAIFVLKFVGDDPNHVLIAAILVTPWSFILWRLMLRVMCWITDKRRAWLTDFLKDPQRG